MLKIAFVDHYYGEKIGGGEEYLLAVAEGLKEKGFEIEIISLPQSSLARETKKRKMKTIEIPFYSANFLAATGRLAAYFSQEKFDIVNTHGYYSNIVGRLAAKRAGNKNIVCTVHVEVKPDFINTFTDRAKFLLRNFVERATSSGVHYIVVSNEVKRQLIEIGIDESAITVIYPGINIEKSPVSESMADKKSKVIFGSCGRLVRVKDFKTLIIAFSRLKEMGVEAELRIYGEGPERENLESLANSLGVLKWVMFPGYQEKQAVYTSIDVFALPSLSEGFPMSLLEAASYGLPCICTSTGGQKEIIENGKTGLIAPPKDPDSLAKAMLWMVNNREEARKMGKAAREFVSRNFTIEKLIKEHVKLFTKIAKNANLKSIR